MATTKLEDLKENVQQKFAEIRAALHMREKLLLRQLDVIAQQQINRLSGIANTSIINDDEIKFQIEQEELLLTTIRTFGRFQLDNMNLALQDVYLKNEDYITPSNDHETMYKCLQQQQQQQQQHHQQLQQSKHGHQQTLQTIMDNNQTRLNVDGEEPAEAIVVDFSRNKSLIEHNTKNMNESIINITLQEAKELIKRAKNKREMQMPPLNLEELDDELESSIADAVSSLGGREELTNNTKSSQTCPPPPTSATAATIKSKKNRFKPKITINNCNGTINLRNISTLTINCATEENVNADIPIRNDDDDDGGVIADVHASEIYVNDGDNDGDGNGNSNGDGDNDSQCNRIKQKLNQKLYNRLSAICSKNSSTTTIVNDSSAAHAVLSVSGLESNSTENSSTPTTTSSSSNYSSNSSSRSQSKKQKSNKKQKQQQQKSQNNGMPTTTTTSTKQNINKNANSTTSSGYPAFEIIDDDDDVDNDVGAHAVTCDFYNRLLNEIKNSLKEKPIRKVVDNTTTTTTSSSSSSMANHYQQNREKVTRKQKQLNNESDNTATTNDTNISTIAHTNDTNAATVSSSSSSSSSSATTTTNTNSTMVTTATNTTQPGKRLILKNFENLKIILEANSDDETFHPIQIEQWLAEIISETDQEPMQNTEILEHSKIDSVEASLTTST